VAFTNWEAESPDFLETWVQISKEINNNEITPIECFFISLPTVSWTLGDLLRIFAGL
jgi:hypothetical protein